MYLLIALFIVIVIAVYCLYFLTLKNDREPLTSGSPSPSPSPVSTTTAQVNIQDIQIQSIQSNLENITQRIPYFKINTVTNLVNTEPKLDIARSAPNCNLNNILLDFTMKLPPIGPTGPTGAMGLIGSLGPTGPTGPLGIRGYWSMRN